jgi:RNA polymerase sigma factor (sigma-70 family)
VSTGTTAPVDSFVAFYRENFQRAFRLAWMLTNGGPDCDDIAQNAFIRVHRNFADVTNAHAYLRTTVVNLCHDAHRRTSREQRRLEIVGAERVSPSPESHLIDMVGSLPYNQRAVLVLRYWADLADAEIAAILGVRAVTVRSIAHRATRQLRKDLAHED